MLPEHLVPPRFHLSPSAQADKTADNKNNLTQGKRTLGDYEADILISAVSTGQAKIYCSKSMTDISKNGLIA